VVDKRAFWSVVVLSLPAATILQGCSSLPSLSSLSSFGRKPASGVDRVDALLTKVEGVQVEAALSKERAHEALTELLAAVDPDFAGDPASTHARLAEKVAASTEQAERFADGVAPMKDLGAQVFSAWTADLENFGSATLRRNSQTRLEETRARFDEIIARTVAVQLAYDAFNRELADHVLYLEHDFNAAAVAALEPEIAALGSQAVELDRRLIACIGAADAYVQASALRGQTELPAADARAAAAAPRPDTSVAKVSERPPVVPRKRMVETKAPSVAPPTPAPVADAEVAAPAELDADSAP
jgi:Protein of unknown function (DUF2959)